MSSGAPNAPDVRALRRALEPGGGGSQDAVDSLDAMAWCRSALGDPLGEHARGSIPDPALRASLISRPEVSLPGAPGQPPLRLAADTVSVAVALADELYINEADAALLLCDARPGMLRRHDRDVVAAAKDLHYSRRRELLLFLQEMLRVHLLGDIQMNSNGNGDANMTGFDEDAEFRDTVRRERDGLIVEKDLVGNVLKRLQAGLPSLASPTAAVPNPSPSNRADSLFNDEAVLLAECLFLISYSVQLTSRDALAVRDLLDAASELHVSVLTAEDARNTHAHYQQQHHKNAGAVGTTGKYQASCLPSSPVCAKVQSVRNLVFLSWICSTDRSRYSDLYDPRTCISGVNSLLSDEDFVRRSLRIPMMTTDDTLETLPSLSPVLAAAELVGTVFRMAVAQPDQHAGISIVIQTCLYADALEFLGTELADWIQTGAGSLLPDSNLYADAFEDFAIDLCEWPDASTALLRDTQTVIQDTKSSSAHDNGVFGGVESALQSHARGARDTSHGLFVPLASSSAGKLPKVPPSGSMLYGTGMKVESSNGVRHGGTFMMLPDRDGSQAADDGTLSHNEGGENVDAGPAVRPKNFIVLLGNLVERAVSMAPAKLLHPSVGGDRYWAGVGPEASGIIQRISEVLLDLHEHFSKRTDGVCMYERAVVAFLKVLAATAAPGGNPVHAGNSLRYIASLGHTGISFEGASKALDRHIEVHTTPASAGLEPVTQSHTDYLIAMLDVLTNCTKSMHSQGLSSMIGRRAIDLPPRITTLALQDVSPSLRSALVRCLISFDDPRSSLTFLEDIIKSKAAKLRQMIRGPEAELGMYDGTTAVLTVATVACASSPDDFPGYIFDALAGFAVEEVIGHWSQRKYASDAERWRLMRSANDFLLAALAREAALRRDDDYFFERSPLVTNVFSKLLCPAPGTGAASPALRALISCAGLRRFVDDPFAIHRRSDQAQIQPERASQNSSVNSFEGREALAFAALSGDGLAFREMEKSVASSARLLLFTLSLPASAFSSHAMITARASDLLLSEPRAIVSAGSLAFAADECETSPTPFRLGYAVTSCAATVSMLASASSQSALICKLLTRDDDAAASARFRRSMADIVASYSIENRISVLDADIDTNGGADEELEQGTGVDFVDFDKMDASRTQRSLWRVKPRMEGALHLVEACLGMDGGAKPGLFVLGLTLDTGHRLRNAEYGVLSSLMRVVSALGQYGSNRIDDRPRAEAANFLERLAGNTIAKTSCAVLEFIRNVGEADGHPSGGAMSVQDGVSLPHGSGWFGDIMLCRVLDLVRAPPKDVNWACLGSLSSACMSLSALLVRQYPTEEETKVSSLQNSDQSFVDRRTIGLTGSRRLQLSYPSPDALLRLVAMIAGTCHRGLAHEAFQNWHKLLASRLAVHSHVKGYGNMPLLLDITVLLLDALESFDSSSEMSILVNNDGGAEAASVVLRCLGKISVGATAQSQSPDEFLGDSQAGILLAKVVRAISRRADGRGDAAQTRTALYASFLVCGQLTETRSSDENIAQAFAGRMGPRQTSGAEALVAVACEDAINGPTAATRAAALVSLAVAARLDPLRVIPALSSQNRLRRVVTGTLSDSQTQLKIVRSCIRGAEDHEQTPVENSAVVVAEAVVSLIHAVSSGADGVRALSDAACLESIASLLEALAAPRHRIQADFRFSPGKFADRSRSMYESMSGREVRLVSRDGRDINVDEDSERFVDAWGDSIESRETPEERSAAVASMLTAAVGAAVRGPDSILGDGALATLHAGEKLYTRIIRALAFPKVVFFSAVSHLSVVLCRVPPRILSDGAVPFRLRSLLASHIGCLVPEVKADVEVGKSGSAMSAGLDLVAPRDPRDIRRSQIQHPEGGSLFERDLITARLECLNCVLAALRPSVGVLAFFSPRFVPGARIHEQEVGVEEANGHSFVDELSGRQANLGDIRRIARASLDTIQHCAKESIRLIGTAADETPASIPSRRLSEFSDYCMEELDLTDEEQLTGDAMLVCLREAAAGSRRAADSCVSVLESTLYILREYTNAASETLRGSNYTTHSAERLALSVRDAEALREEANESVMPLCREIDTMSASVWGHQDPSFCRQLCRQIRTNLTSSF